jgi:glyoxylase-like metal-dependent hydrolase (beta-lactamase superfamily II)
MTADQAVEKAKAQVQRVIDGAANAPVVHAFFHEPTFTASYVVHDPETLRGAIIDSVLDFDQPSGRTATPSADDIIAYVNAQCIKIDWIIETHAHADHVSAAPYLQDKVGGKIVIGKEILTVQNAFGAIFNEGPDFKRNGSQFDCLTSDGEAFALGNIPVIALHVPGHTPADMAYVIGDAVFVGDTMFMPDYGSARADFPGGDARHLFRAIRRLMQLPDASRVFLCHDYKAPQRDTFIWETTMKAQRTGNVHVHEGIAEDDFVAMRMARDKTLGMPKLILPSIQINIRAGHFPEPETNGTRYLKLPLNLL